MDQVCSWLLEWKVRSLSFDRVCGWMMLGEIVGFASRLMRKNIGRERIEWMFNC